MPLQETLDTLAGSLRAELAGSGRPRPGEALTARVGSLPPQVELVEMQNIELNLSAVLDPVTVARAAGPVTRLAKNVQFRSFYPEDPGLDPADLGTTDGPIVDRTPLPTDGLGTVAGTSGVLEQLSGLVGELTVSGLLGRLTGTVGIPVVTRRSLSLQVDWRVLDAGGNDLVEGRDFLAPAGLTGPAPSFVFIPGITTTAPGEELTRVLRATATLSAGAATVVRTLPDLEVQVLPLVLPLASLLRPAGTGPTLSAPGVPSEAAIVPDLRELKPLTGAFDLVWEQAATGPRGLTLPLHAEWTVTRDEAGREAVADDLFHAPSLAGSAVSLVLRPRVVECAAGLPPISEALQNAWLQVRVRVAGLTDWVALPALQLPVPTLEIPTMVAMFNHGSFSLATYGGIPPCVLVLVPSNSTIGSNTPESVAGALATLRVALQRLAVPFPSIPGLGALADAVGPVARLAELLATVAASATDGEEKGWKLIVRPSDYEGLMERIVFYREVLYKHSAEDTFGSLIFVGRPGRAARFYIARNGEAGDGAFDLTLMRGEIPILAAVVDSLHSDPPSCDPPEAVSIQSASNEGTFGNRISSFRFLPDT